MDQHQPSVSITLSDQGPNFSKVESLSDDDAKSIIRIHNSVDEGDIPKFEEAITTSMSANNFSLFNTYKNLTIMHRACKIDDKEKAYKMTAKIEDWYCKKGKCSSKDIEVLVNRKTDNTGETPLHIASKYHNKNVAWLLLKFGADYNIKCKQNIRAISSVWRYIPEVIFERFNDGIMATNIEHENKFDLKLDYTDLILLTGHSNDNNNREPLVETDMLANALMNVSQEYRLKLLGHPLVQLFLADKWQILRIFIWGLACLNLMWSVIYIVLAILIYNVKCPNSNESFIPCDNFGGIWMWNLVLLIIFCILSFPIFLEAFCRFYVFHQGYDSPSQTKCHTWILLLFSIVLVLRSFTIVLNTKILIFWGEYSLASVGILISVWSLSWQMKRFMWFGLMIRICWKIVKALIAHILLFIGFSLAIQLLMPEKDEFSLFCGFNGLFKIFSISSTGEWNYDDLFHEHESSKEVPSPTTTKLVFFALQAVLVMSFLGIVNGIAVYDAKKQMEEADLLKSSDMIKELHLLEMLVASDYFGKHDYGSNILLARNPEKRVIYFKKYNEVPDHLNDQIRKLFENRKLKRSTTKPLCDTCSNRIF